MIGGPRCFGIGGRRIRKRADDVGKERQVGVCRC